MTVQEQRERHQLESPQAATQHPSASPQQPLIVLPVAIATPLQYPPNASGEGTVLLALTIEKDGTVSAATAAKGESPFAEAAVRAAQGWTFHPAFREGRAVSAKIQFLVKFIPPEPLAEEKPSPPRLATPTAPVNGPKQNVPEDYEVFVHGDRAPIRHQLGQAEIREMPGAFGDPYRAIESLPGVVPIVSGLPYFYVRGAPPGNVGYFFDGVPVPYLYHFAAGPGVLHPAFVDHVDLYPGAYPARYGRFAGAIVAGEMAPAGNRLRGEASIRLIDSGAMLEAPFASGRGSVMAGGRYSYTGLVISLVVPEVKLNYWDYQTRVRYSLDSRNSIEVLAFGAGDYLASRETEYEAPRASTPDASQASAPQPTTRERSVVDVNFHRMDLRWDRRIARGRWRNAIMLGMDQTGFDESNVTVVNRLVGARTEWSQRTEGGTEMRSGADVLFESLSQQFEGDRLGSSSSENAAATGAPTGDATAPGATGGTTASDDRQAYGFDPSRKDLTAGVWADAVLNVARNVQLTPGLRLDLFNSGSRAALGVDPRISVRYQLSKGLSAVHGLAVVHQAPSFVVPVPGFKPSLAGGLQSAVQHSAGVSFPLPADFSASATVFQNLFFNMTDLLGLARLSDTRRDSTSDDLSLRSLGHAYGAEVMIRRSLARNLGGFVSYTLSRSVRSSGSLEGPSTTDRTHVLNVAASYNLGRNWRFGSRWLLYSGIPSKVAYIEAAQSPPRTPVFWRIDAKLQKRWYIKQPDAWWGFVFEVLNTTLNKETLNGSCNAYRCKFESFGPVTVPSIGVEGAF
jgi:TonB family protein